MTSQERQQFWKQHIEVWQATDLSGAAFCKQHDLNYPQFNYWRKKFQVAEAAEKSAGFGACQHSCRVLSNQLFNN